MRKAVIITFTILFSFGNTFSQKKVYFVDGYHGGIYGHYPMWVTQFMVDKLAQYPEWRIGIEIEPESWDTVKVREPIAYNNFKNIVTDKRIEFTNPTWAQPYCYNISGESLIRQFEYGIKRIHKHFPDVAFTTYSVEEPCFTSSLPQILKQFGFKYAVLKCPNTCWGGYTAAYGGELVNWIGPDGTSILTVPRSECEELEVGSTWQTKAWSNSEDYLKACFDYGIKNPVGMCYQDAGWRNGPWLGVGNRIKNNSIYVTWKEYIEEISDGKTNDDYHFSQEDMRVNLMWGSQVLQKIAQEVRVSENKIVMAEKIGAMANIDNAFILSQQKIDDAWRTLLMAQHHDSWIVPYNGLNKYRTWAEEITLWTNHTNKISDEIVSNAINTYSLNESDKSDNLGYIRVYNTLGIKRNEVVRIALPSELADKNISVYDAENKLVSSVVEKNSNSTDLIFRSDVPSLGYSTYRLSKKKVGEKEVVNTKFDANGNCIIENDMYKIIFDPAKGGIITSLIAKKENSKEFVQTDSKFHLGELRGYFYDDKKFYSSTDTPAKITVTEDNVLQTKVKIEGEIASHPYTQILTLTSGQKRIDFNLKIDWKDNVGIGEYKQSGSNWRDNRRGYTDDRYKLNVMFPVDLGSATLYKNAPFDVCESKQENTFFGKWSDIKHNIILNWVDLVQKEGDYGFALFSDHTTSYSYADDFPLSLTAQYSGIGLWGPNYRITRSLDMNYSILPHTGKWDQATISTQSNTWNEPLLTSFHKSAEMKSKSFVEFAKPGYEVVAFKTKGSNILLRVFNTEGDNTTQKIMFNFPCSVVEEVDLRGKIIEQKSIAKILGKNAISTSMPRFGIKTFLIKKIEEI